MAKLHHVDRLRAIVQREMQEQGITQEKLAKKAGVSQSTVSAFLAGTTHPSAHLVERLARGVGKKIVFENR